MNLKIYIMQIYARSGGMPETYIRIFHFLHRKAFVASFLPMKLLCKILFRLWANRRGLEITANNQIGG